MAKISSLSDETYAKMHSAKKQGESFTDIVRQRPLVDFFGKWPASGSVKKTLQRDRKSFRTRELSFD